MFSWLHLKTSSLRVDKEYFLSREEYRYSTLNCLMKLKQCSFFFSVPIFKNLPEETLIKISDVLEEVIFSVFIKPIKVRSHKKYLYVM